MLPQSRQIWPNPAWGRQLFRGPTLAGVDLAKVWPNVNNGRLLAPRKWTWPVREHLFVLLVPLLLLVVCLYSRPRPSGSSYSYFAPPASQIEATLRRGPHLLASRPAARVNSLGLARLGSGRPSVMRMIRRARGAIDKLLGAPGRADNLQRCAGMPPAPLHGPAVGRHFRPARPNGSARLDSARAHRSSSISRLAPKRPTGGAKKLI